MAIIVQSGGASAPIVNNPYAGGGFTPAPLTVGNYSGIVPDAPRPAVQQASPAKSAGFPAGAVLLIVLGLVVILGGAK